MADIIDAFSFDSDMTTDIQKDVEKYRNQGGLLGIFTYFLIYLKTSDEDLAETSAAIPTTLFALSSLHDDAIDMAANQDDNLKQFLNLRTTLGDQLFTYTLEYCEELPENFNCSEVAEQMRKIGRGQLREETVTSTGLSVDKAIARVEERGSVWGGLAVAPVEAGGYYSDDQLTKIYTFCENLLFVLTVIDDVEDIPEDVKNDTINIPLMIFGRDPSEFESHESLIQSFLESNVPDRLDSLCRERESEMEDAAREFFEQSDYSREEMLEAWNRTLEWYRDSVCTVPVSKNVPPTERQEIKDHMTGSDDERHRYLLDKVMTGLPVRIPSKQELVSVANSLPGTKLSPVVIIMLHIEYLVDSVMTTELDEALANLRRAVTED